MKIGNRILLTLIIFAAGVSLAAAKSPPPGVGGAASVPANILIMLDNSGSMGNSATSRMAQAKAVINALVTDPDLSSDVQFGLMEWNSKNPCVRCPIGPTSNNCIITTALPEIESNGGTSPHSAFVEVQDYFDGNSYNRCGGQGSCYYFPGAVNSCVVWSDSGSPIDPALACQVTAIVFISDGSYGGSPEIPAAQLHAQGIDTYVVGFMMGNNTNYNNLALAGGTVAPLYTNNQAQLLQALKAAILQIVASRQASSAPAVIPASYSGSGYILQSSFTVEGEHQWPGHLMKYELDGDAKPKPNPVWDAGEELDNRTAASRNIWTVGKGLCSGANLPSGINNFTVANASDLACALYDGNDTPYSALDTANLIRFVRGVDSYDEDSDGSILDERWKLADIYHSELRIVGPPALEVSGDAAANTGLYYRWQKGYETFKNANSSRPEVVYVGSNTGMLHAFDYATGEELWAFIPPAMLPRLREMVSFTANTSNSIYGVDGSPIVRDVYMNGNWKTVLISGMRQGGKSYFALDVTDVANPGYLFGFSNNPADGEVQCWDACGEWP